MTEDEMKKQLQFAQDLLAGLERQRNAAQTEAAHLNAQLAAAMRRIEEFEKAVSPVDGAIAPQAKNGHDPAPALAS